MGLSDRIATGHVRMTHVCPDHYVRVPDGQTCPDCVRMLRDAAAILSPFTRHAMARTLPAKVLR